jgi:NAD(P)-dependent dehydrogenase (short-subunit alcohol dehydrogenase family)
MSVSYELSGRSAIVTGGAKGIGRAIAGYLVAAGARVWVWDISPAILDDAECLIVDITDPEQIDKALAQINEQGSSIDILVNNAGYLGEPVAVERLQPEDWRRVFDVNLTGMFEVTRKVLPHMRKAAAGRIVNMASVAGKEGFPNLSAYSAASAGVIAFTKSLGKELPTLTFASMPWRLQPAIPI